MNGLVIAAMLVAEVTGPRVDVAIIRPVSDDRVLGEAAARIGLELTASGLTSAVVDVAGDDFPGRIALVREDGVATIDLIGTLADGKPLHRRIPVRADEGGDDPAVLAVRAVELLRGIRLGVRAPKPGPGAARSQEAPDVAAVSAPPRARTGELVRVGVGVVLLEHRFTSQGTTPGVLLSLSAPITPHATLVLAAAGPFVTHFPATPDGTAMARQSLGAFGVRLDSSRERSSTHVVFATGLEHIEATYDPRGAPVDVPPPELQIRKSHDLWQPLVLVGTGVSGRFLRWFGCTFDTSFVFSPPTLDIMVNGRRVGSLAGPSFMYSLTLWAAFP